MRKINSFRNCKPLFGLFFLIMSIGVWGQTILQYPLNSNLTPDIGPAVGLNPQINYFSPPSTVPVPIGNLNFGGNALNFVNSGDYLQVTFDATDFEGLTLESRVGLWGLGFASGNVKVYMKIGSNPEELLPNGNVDLDYFLFGSDYHTFSLPLSSADGESQVTIRIVGTSSSFAIFNGFGIDFFRLVSNNTTMNVRRFNPPNTEFPIINHNSSASVTLDTDYGDLLTNEGSLTKTFRITNTGSRTLNINNMSIQPNDQGFELVGAIPTSVPVGGQGYFDVRFAPESQGMKLANVVINSNAIPDNPFSFQVIGRGKSCNTAPVSIAFQHFEPEGGMQSNLDMQIIQGAPSTIGGTGASPINSPVTRLYPNSNLYSSSSPNRSLYARGNETGEITMNFGPVDITNQQEVSISFDIAAFGATNDSNSGVNSDDYIILGIYNPTTGTYSEEIRLEGGNSNTRRKYEYGTGISGTKNTVNGSLQTFRNNNTANYSRLEIKIPASYPSNELRFQIKAKTGQTRITSWFITNYYDHNFWLIDNVSVNAGNGITKVWNGTSWVGGRPNSREIAVINAAYDFSGTENMDLEVCECEVRNNRPLTIPNGRSLILRNKLVNFGSANNVIVQNDGNLIQKENNVANLGNIEVQKQINLVNGENPLEDRKQYNLVISPVIGQSIKTIYPGNPVVIEYRESTNFFYNHSGAYTAGKGYGVKEPSKQSVPESILIAKFQGVPFNGELSYPLTRSNPEDMDYGFNLIGNPYPSNLDILQLYQDNKNLIESTFYFWDNRGNTLYTQLGSEYSGSNYAIYNAESDTGLPVGTAATGSPTPLKTPNQYVKVGTGFMVQAKMEGEIKFKNAYRTNNNTGSAFFGKNNINTLNYNFTTATPTISNKDRYWLSLTTSSGMRYMNAVVYFQGGTNEYGMEDSDAMGTSDEIFTVVEQQYLAIDGRPSFETTDVVQLGIRHFENGKFQIRLEITEGVFDNGQIVYLKDKYLNVLHDLTKGAYGYESEAGEFIDRFEILYKKPGLTNTALTSAVVNHLKIFKHNQDIVLESSDDKILGIEIFNLSGTSLYKRDNINSKEHRVFRESLGKQILIINLITEKGELVSRKFINN